jgi:hypothetical protein
MSAVEIINGLKNIVGRCPMPVVRLQSTQMPDNDQPATDNFL